jgi:hypothetical protein
MIAIATATNVQKWSPRELKVYHAPVAKSSAAKPTNATYHLGLRNTRLPAWSLIDLA